MILAETYLSDSKKTDKKHPMIKKNELKFLKTQKQG